MTEIDVSIPSEAKFRTRLQGFFESNGFHLEPIPEADEERADFFVEKEGVRVLVELKIKGDDLDEAEDREAVMEDGQIYSYSESSHRRNTLSGIVKKGVSQLEATPGLWDFRLLWIHCAGHYSHHCMTRFRNTIYGMRFLFHSETKEEPKYCYYFEESDFFRFRNMLSGVVLTEGNTNQLQLCINDHHSLADEFRQSAFRKTFGTGYCDPTEFEEKGDAYIVDGPVNRRDENAVTEYLDKRYRCGHTQSLDMAMHTCGMRVAP